MAGSYHRAACKVEVGTVPSSVENRLLDSEDGWTGRCVAPHPPGCRSERTTRALQKRRTRALLSE